MSFIKTLESYDATRGIPRPADAQHLPPYQAFLRCLSTGLFMLVLVACGAVSAYLLYLSAAFLNVSTQVWFYFAMGMMVCVMCGLMEALQEIMPYYRFKQRLTYGTARWADELYLKNTGLALQLGDSLSALPPGAIRIGKLKKGYDLVLPVNEWLRHLFITGPPGSGKSKTFLMNIIRDVARGGSAIVLDPKGELYEQTAGAFRQVYRFDLVNPTRSDRWNFVPKCKNNGEFASQMAATMIGLEGTKHSVADPFWQEAELLLLKAILLHLPDIVDEPTPPMCYEYTAMRDMKSIETEMGNSTNSAVKLAWGAFQKAPPQTQGSVVTGLMNKLQAFQIDCAQAVCAPISDADRAAGVRQIDFGKLRRPGTAIYIVIAEGDASRLKTFLSSFIGQAVNELRVDVHSEDAAPVMFVLDEAANVPLVGLKEIAGVGRGRKIGLCLGYQNLPQVQDQYGHDGANAIIGSVGTTIFLPGLDDATTQFASRRIGQTTVWSHTTVDGKGTKLDNERQSETGRALMDPTELRQMVKHRQCVVVIDTSPPIKAGYPPYAVQRARALPNEYGTPKLVSLVEAEEEHLKKVARKMREQEAAEAAATLGDGTAEEGEAPAVVVAVTGAATVTPPGGGPPQPALLPETIDGGENFAPGAPAASEPAQPPAVAAPATAQEAVAATTAGAATAATQTRVNSAAGGEEVKVSAGAPQAVQPSAPRGRGDAESRRRTKPAPPPDPNQPPLYFSDQGVQNELMEAAAEVVGRQRPTIVKILAGSSAKEGGGAGKGEVSPTVLTDDAILNGRGSQQDSLR